MSAIIGMQIPRMLADVFGPTLTELDQLEVNFSVILSPMQKITNLIAL